MVDIAIFPQFPRERQTWGHADLWTKIVFIRALVAQIAFHEIGYSGPYESYINGYKTVHGQ